jgi:hypothetical protein
MDDTGFLVQIPDALRDLDDDVPGEILAEIGELHDLMEEFATLADCWEREDESAVVLLHLAKTWLHTDVPTRGSNTPNSPRTTAIARCPDG